MYRFVKQSCIMVRSTANFSVPLRLPVSQFVSHPHTFTPLVIITYVRLCVALKERESSNARNFRNCNNAISLTNALLCVCLHHMESLEPEG